MCTLLHRHLQRRARAAVQLCNQIIATQRSSEMKNSADARARFASPRHASPSPPRSPDSRSDCILLRARALPPSITLVRGATNMNLFEPRFITHFQRHALPKHHLLLPYLSSATAVPLQASDASAIPPAPPAQRTRFL